MRKNSLWLIGFITITYFSFVSGVGTPYQNYKYYFNITCKVEGEGYYGEHWDMTLIVECSCIESSYLYEDITIYILFYEMYQGNEELTKTVSFFFGDMKPDDSKTLSKTIKTKYPVIDQDNLRGEISNDVTFTKTPMDDPDFPVFALLVVIVVVGIAGIIGFLIFRSQKQVDSVYTLGTTPKTQFVSSHKAPTPSELDNITALQSRPMIVCSKCSATMQGTQKFCSECGAEIEE